MSQVALFLPKLELFNFECELDGEDAWLDPAQTAKEFDLINQESHCLYIIEISKYITVK